MAIEHINIIIFGGTTEGRLLAEFCVSQGIRAYVSVISDYGADLLPDSALLYVRRQAMTQEEMEAFFRQNEISMVIDATHPYAAEVTANILHACENAGITRYRVVRNQEETSAHARYFDTMAQLVAYLEQTSGGIFVTTGSKELSAFLKLPDYAARCTVRVLDAERIVMACQALGYLKEQIIALRGPFSVEENIAHFKQSGAKYLVTKESGSAGGFGEKLRAAKACGMEVLILKRTAETGVSLGEMCDILMKNVLQ